MALHWGPGEIQPLCQGQNHRSINNLYSKVVCKECVSPVPGALQSAPSPPVPAWPLPLPTVRTLLLSAVPQHMAFLLNPGLRSMLSPLPRVSFPSLFTACALQFRLRRHLLPKLCALLWMLGASPVPPGASHAASQSPLPATRPGAAAARRLWLV